MSVQLMHINFSLAYQKLNKGAKLDLQEPEVDMLLNLATRVFIKRRTNPKGNKKIEGADESFKRIEDLETITELAKPLQVYKIDDKTSYTQLPPDFYFLYGSASLMNCSKTSSVSLNRYFVPVDLGSIKYDAQDLITAFTIRIDFGAGYSTLYEIGSIIPLYKGLEFEILHDILSTNFVNAKIYWQWYNGTFYNNQFIIESTLPFKIEVTTDNPVETNSTLLQLQTYVADTKTIYSVDRLIGKHELRQIIDYTYSKPTIRSVITSRSKNLLYIHHPPNFTVSTVELDYIKRPIFVNYFKNRNSDLPLYVQDEIIGIAVELATVYDKTRNLQDVVAENDLND